MGIADAILIPGGGVREGGALPSWVERRLDRAVQLDAGQYIITLSAATTHRPPPLDKNSFPIFESVAAAKYLIDAGVQPERILTETHSYDTIGNAFFSRVIHADPLRLCRLLVITSDFHLPRAQAVFNWIYGLEPRTVPYELQFESVFDPSMDGNVLRDREEKERRSLASLADLTNRITTLRDLHRWLFTEHEAYKAAGRDFGSRRVGDAALLTY
jgi:uncharacterized SAM-binding protein YcdF (DUF218 family)